MTLWQRVPAKVNPNAKHCDAALLVGYQHRHLRGQKQAPVGAAIVQPHAGHMAISAITLAELLRGAERSNAPSRSLAAVEDFCTRMEVLPYGPKAAQHYGSIRSALEKRGQTIGVNDLHIAAHARS